MRKRVKKTLSFLTALAMIASVFCGSGLFVDAEDAEDTAVVWETEGGETGAGEVNTVPEAETGLVEYAPSEQPEGVSVKAFAQAGVLPEGTIMTAARLTEEGDTAEEYREAAETLEAGGVAYDGFAAFDISFWDAEGNRIEPENGSVQVKLELSAGMIPEEADMQSLEVQHLAETSEGIKVETVADAADRTVGSIAADGECVKADFTVDSFSKFTITWDGKFADRSVTVKYVDQDGNELACSGASDVTVNMENTITLANYAYGLSEYTYRGARLNNIDGAAVTQIRAYYSWGSYYFQYTGDGKSWNDLDNNAEILLVYQKESAVTPPVEQEKQLAHDKYVEEKDDGTYDLTLTIAGAVGSQTTKQKLDVIYVLDVSGSMARNMNNDDGRNGERREKAGNAINSLTNSLANNSNLDTRFALITFSGDDDDKKPDANVIVDWTSASSDITRNSKPSSNGGTNYQAGIIEAKELLENKRDGALTAVIFISDGDPTFRYGTDQYGNLSKNVTRGNGRDDNDGSNLQAAKTEVGSLNSNYFFTVGVGPSSNYAKLRELKDAASLVPDANRNFYEGTDESTLNAAFNDIQVSITQILCSNVTVTDALSDNVQLVMDTNGTPKPLTVTVKDSEGNVVASGVESVTLDGAVIRAEYNSETKQIVLDFPDEYQLKAGYTYMVTANIEATETAYEKYRGQGNAYVDRGDAGTGETSAGELGVYTNKEAKVTYTYNGTPSEEVYAMPVIQLHPGILVIEKTINGLENDADAKEYLEKNLAFEVQLNDGEKQQIGLGQFTYDETTKKYSYQIKGLSPKTKYSVEELNADISSVHAYEVETEKTNIANVVEGDGTQTAAFINTYQPSQRSLTIIKNVDGSMGDKNQAFSFSLELKKNGEVYTEALKYSKNGEVEQELNASDNTYTFALKDRERIVLTIPYGCEYTIVEDNLDYTVKVDTGNGESVQVENAKTTGTLTTDKTITYQNTKDINTPTGVIRTMTPFFLMIAAALGAAVILGFRRRRLR